MSVSQVGKITVPDRDTTLWRYMSFTKWLSLISSSSLYFTRLDLLGDEFEGYLPPPEDLSLSPESGRLEGVSDEQTLRHIHELAWAMRYQFFVSCWTINPFESMAMWKLYAPALEAVAIKTNVGRLIDSLNLHEITSYAGAVKYEPSADFVMENMVELAYLKRPAFNNEREFRLCYIDLAVNETEGELSLATDTNCLSP